MLKVYLVLSASLQGGWELWLKGCPVATEKTTPRALNQFCHIPFLSRVE